MERKPLISLYEACKLYGYVADERPRFVAAGMCQWCGKKIEDKRKKAFCSKECSTRFNRIVTWQRTRNAYSTHIIWRDNLTCQDCGTLMAIRNEHDVYLPIDNGAEVHHMIPVSDGGTDSPDNLVTLCHDCHLERHNKMRCAGAVKGC